MIVFPNAKINIGLNILTRRPDGYHTLETILYPVQIKDALEIIKSHELQFQFSGLPIPGLTSDNLCFKAYQLIARDHTLPPLKVHLHKHIPIGAGLGGGSADAGFFIRLLNDVCSLGLSKDQMLWYARELGADCAFFIENKPLFAFEKGDYFEPIQVSLCNYKLVVVVPPISISTKIAYDGIEPSTPKESLRLAIQRPITQWKYTIKNDFEGPIVKAHPEIATIKMTLYECGAVYACMSGSGPSVFGIFQTQPDLSCLSTAYQVFYTD